METSENKFAEKIEKILSSRPKPKDEDYYKIWDSWGMTKEEWKALPINSPKAG